MHSRPTSDVSDVQGIIGPRKHAEMAHMLSRHESRGRKRCRSEPRKHGTRSQFDKQPLRSSAWPLSLNRFRLIVTFLQTPPAAGAATSFQDCFLPDGQVTLMRLACSSAPKPISTRRLTRRKIAAAAVV